MSGSHHPAIGARATLAAVALLAVTATAGTATAGTADVDHRHDHDGTPRSRHRHHETVSLHVGHMSGRFNAPEAQVVDYIVKLMEYRHLDALTTTESEEPGIGPDVRARLGSRFHVVKRHEYMIITRNSRLVPVHDSLSYRALSSNIVGREAWRNMYTASSSYHVVGSDKKVILYATHAPATVDMSDPHYRPGITGPKIASRVGFTAMGRWITARSGPNVVQLSNMDSNVDWHNAMWRDTVLGETGGISIWSASRPAVGTHADNRLIDTAIVFNATIVTSSISPANLFRPAAMDHKTIEYRVSFPRH